MYTKVETLAVYELEGKVSDIIKELESLKIVYGADVTLVYNSYTSYGDNIVEYEVHRPETEREKVLRETKQAELQKKQDEYQRKQYELLKKKFGE